MVWFLRFSGFSRRIRQESPRFDVDSCFFQRDIHLCLFCWTTSLSNDLVTRLVFWNPRIPGSKPFDVCRDPNVFGEFLKPLKGWTRGKTGVHQLRLLGYPIIYKLLYIPAGAGFLPSTVVSLNGKVTSNIVGLSEWSLSSTGMYPYPYRWSWHVYNL